MTAENDPFKELEQDITNLFQAAVQGSQEKPPRPKTGGRQKKRVGAPAENQNARKHGLYARALTPEQQELLPEARSADYLTDEIAVLRIKIDALLADPATDPDLIIRAMGMLSRMVRIDTRVRIGV